MESTKESEYPKIGPSFNLKEVVIYSFHNDNSKQKH